MSYIHCSISTPFTHRLQKIRGEEKRGLGFVVVLSNRHTHTRLSQHTQRTLMECEEHVTLIVTHTNTE